MNDSATPSCNGVARPSAVPGRCRPLLSPADGSRRRPAASTSASRPSAPASARRARPRSPAATCWSSCPPARASRSATSCPALMRDDLTIVVSPLVALMQDQVEALQARGLGDRVALVNAQQDAEANARRARARGRRRPAPALRGAGAVLLAGVPRGDARGARSGCSSSTRPTASRSGGTTSGPTTSASPTPPATSARGRSSPPPPPPRRGSRSTSRGGSACAIRCRVATGFDRPEHLVRGRAPGAAREAAR